MKNLIIGLVLGLAVGLTCTACSVAKDTFNIHHMSMVNTDRNSIYTTIVNTEEGTYRIFTYEGQNGGGGITAVKIK